MPIDQVGQNENRQLQNIANILASSKRVVVITGAGISTNSGIPVSFSKLNHESPLTILGLPIRRRPLLSDPIQVHPDH